MTPNPQLSNALLLPSSTPPAPRPTSFPHRSPPSDLAPASPSPNTQRGRVDRIQPHARPCDSIQRRFSFFVRDQLRHPHRAKRLNQGQVHPLHISPARGLVPSPAGVRSLDKRWSNRSNDLR